MENNTSIFLIINGVLLLIPLVIYLYYTWAFQYWKKKNVSSVPPSIPFGNATNVFRLDKYIGLILKERYLVGKQQNVPYVGTFFFTSPKLSVLDPNVIKDLLQQNFSHFSERGFYCNEKDDPLSANLFALGGEKWRYFRNALKPAFSSAKLKLMFEEWLQCGIQLKESIRKIYEQGNQLDIRNISNCYSIDVIGLCGFGVNCNCFKYSNPEFKKYGKKIFEFTSFIRIAKMVACFAFPKLARVLGLTLFDRDCTQIFLNIVKETITYRRTNGVVRNDIIQLLMELKSFPSSNDLSEAEIKEITAQVFVFFAAGFETFSVTLSYCLYELAVNQNIQDKVRKEIKNVLSKYDNNVTYEAVMDLKYTAQVLDETLRKYPPVSYITRKCVKDYQIPNTTSLVEKGIEIIISIFGIHHDPDYYPNPELFDPERFSPDNKKQIMSCTYLPFGEGPRTCIGLRFGMLQLKVALVMLLTNYRFAVSEKTVQPLQFEPFSFTLIPKFPIYLCLEKC